MSYKVRGGKLQRKSHRTSTIAFGDLGRQTDIQVEGKAGQCVMIMANSNGRRAVEDLFPDVEWTTDHFFAQFHSSDWQFTHIKVTRLPPHFEAGVLLAFASPDALGFAVALSLQRHYEMGRVGHWQGEGADLKVGLFDCVPPPSDADVALFAEHVPAGTTIREPVWGRA